MIALRDVCFDYDLPGGQTRRVLDRVTLEFREGESIAVMGPNGSGKTTLARCLNGLLVPTEGEVLVDGLTTRDPSVLREIRRRVGLVFQNPEHQIVSTTVEREIAFGLENLGVPPQEMRVRVERLLEQFDLRHCRNHPPHLLSGGEKQRVALASVLAMNPRYLVLDEPTSLLDPPSRGELRRLLEESAGELCTVLITQYPEEALGAERLIVLHQGRVEFDDAPEDVFTKVAELKAIGLDVPMSFELQRLWNCHD